MSIARLPATATLLAATAGALLSAALLGSPVASADDLPTLPVPPFDPLENYDYFNPIGTAGAITNSVGGDSLYHFDQAYALSDGSYEVLDSHTALFLPEPFYIDDSQQVISSDGVAPAVGTVWDNSSVQIPSFGFSYALFDNSSLTTPDGTVDSFIVPNSDWANIYYQGPAGTIDYLVHDFGTPDVSYTPIFDIPAAGDTAASINPADLAGLGDVTSLATLATEIQALF
jgi:hypothetical protein